jgi:hypothetical protein
MQVRSKFGKYVLDVSAGRSKYGSKYGKYALGKYGGGGITDTPACTCYH